MAAEKTYCELPASELINVNFADVIETSEDTLRWNDDKSVFIVKWIGLTPRFIPRDTLEKTAPAMRAEMAVQGDWSQEPE